MATKASSNNIKIHFRAEGERELINAIQTLAAATTQLKNSQRQLARTMGLTDKEQKKLVASGTLALRNQRNMNAAAAQGNMTFSVFRSKLLLASFAVTLFGASIGKLIKAFQEQESSEKRLEAVLKSTAGISGLTAKEIKKMTAEIEDTGIVADEVNNKIAAFLLTFTNIRKDGFDRTLKAVNNMAIGLSGTIPNFEQLRGSAMMLAKALQDPVGRLGDLGRAGFTFSEEQEKMIKQLVEQGNLFEAQGILLDAAETQFGGLQEAMAQTSEGAYAQLNNAAITLAETLGEDLAKSGEEFARWATRMLKILDDNADKIIILAVAVRDAAIAYYGARTAIWAVNAAINAYNAGLSRAIIRQAAVTFGLSIIAATSAAATQRSLLLRAEGDLGTDMWDGYSNSVLKTSRNLTDLKEKQEKAHNSLIRNKELAIVSINLENKELLGLTTTEIAHFEQQRRQIMIEQELAKLDKEDRKGMREKVTLFVETKIKYEDFLAARREDIKLIKERNKEIEDERKLERDLDALREGNIAKDAKLHFLRENISNEEKQGHLDRIDRFLKLNQTLRGMNKEVLELDEKFLLSGISLKELGDIMFQTNSTMDLYTQALIQDIILTGEVSEATKELGKDIKEVEKAAQTAAEVFQEMAGQAMTAFTGFSGAYTNLITERQNREIEAIKSTSDYERANQDQREIMLERVNQKYRKQARRAFQMEKAGSIAQAIINTHEGYTEALSKNRLGLAALIASLGAAQVAAIVATPAPKFAVGGSFITSGATPMMVGEQGAERVTIQPLAGQKRKAASGGGGNITINISAPLVDDTIVDVIIPKIKEATKLNLA